MLDFVGGGIFEEKREMLFPFKKSIHKPRPRDQLSPTQSTSQEYTSEI